MGGMVFYPLLVRKAVCTCIGIARNGILTGLIGGGGQFSASSPFLVPLWFLRDLMVVTLCSPLLYYILKKTRFMGILFLTIFYITGTSIHIPGFSCMAFCFFSIGAYMKIFNDSIYNVTYDYRYYIAIIAVVLWLICTLYDGHHTKIGNIIYPFYVLFGFITLLNISSFIVNKSLMPIPAYLSKASFFIYLSHTIIILPFFSSIAVKVFGDHNPFLMSVSYLLVPTATIFVCLFMYFLLRVFLPSLCGVLTGDR